MGMARVGMHWLVEVRWIRWKLLGWMSVCKRRVGVRVGGGGVSSPRVGEGRWKEIGGDEEA